MAIESILNISRATSTIIEYLDSFCRQVISNNVVSNPQVTWRVEGSKHLLKLLVKMYHNNCTQVKLVGSMEVLKMLSVNQVRSLSSPISFLEFLNTKRRFHGVEDHGVD